MTGELEKLNVRRRYLEASLEHLDATLAMLTPDYHPTLVKTRFPRRKSKLFGAGKLNAMILSVMQKAERPMTQREVTTGVWIEAGFEEEAEAGLRPLVRAILLYLAKVRGLLALQLQSVRISESMSFHDSENRGWRACRSRILSSSGRRRCGR